MINLEIYFIFLQQQKMNVPVKTCANMQNPHRKVPPGFAVREQLNNLFKKENKFDHYYLISRCTGNDQKSLVNSAARQ